MTSMAAASCNKLSTAVQPHSKFTCAMRADGKTSSAQALVAEIKGKSQNHLIWKLLTHRHMKKNIAHAFKIANIGAPGAIHALRLFDRGSGGKGHAHYQAQRIVRKQSPTLQSQVRVSSSRLKSL